jgi:hypothetical protein
MAVGLGARKSNADTKYFVAASQPDAYVTGGVSAGRILTPFPGSGGGSDGNWDATSLWVWGITGAALAVILGVHFSFGGFRI